MDHLDVMAALRQLVGQLVNENTISSKIVGGIEGGDHAETHREVLTLLANYHLSSRLSNQTFRSSFNRTLDCRRLTIS